MKTRAGVAVLALVLTVAGSANASNGEKPVGFGAPASGRGGVDYGFAEDATAAQTNPAGIAFVNDRMDWDFAFLLSLGNFTNGFGREKLSPEWTVDPLYQLGVVIDPTALVHLGDLGDPGSWGLSPDRKAEDCGGPFHLGLGIFTDTGSSFRFRHIVTPSYAPTALEYRGEEVTLSIAPTFAFRIGDHFSIGYTPSFRISQALLGTFGARLVALAFSLPLGGCHTSHDSAPILSASLPGILIVTAESPPTGPVTGGTTITLTGTGFQPGIQVLVGGLSATNVTIVSNSTLTCVTPAGYQGASDITVFYPSTGQGFVLPSGFNYLTLPQIYAINPTAIPHQASALNLPFVLTGAGFVPGVTTVLFGTTPATGVVVQSTNFLTGTIPQSGTAQVVTVSINVAGVPNTVPPNTPAPLFQYQ